MNQIKKSLLKKIIEKGTWVSDGEYAAECGVSAEQVREVCEAIAGASCGAIEYRKGRLGIGCLRMPTALMPTLIEECAEGVLVREVMLFPETDSTNDVAWGWLGRPNSSGMVVLAESQRSGRGRFSDRIWRDMPGCSILMSVLLDGGLVDGESLSVSLGLAAAKAIGDISGLKVGIKWPNDILVKGKKLCGIMVESRVVDGRQWYVLGIGINCNQECDDFADELKGCATSVYIETGHKVDRNLLAVWLLCEIDELFSGRVSREEIVGQWRARNCDVGRMVSVMCDGEEYSGKVVAVEPMAGITLLLNDGREREFDCRTTTILPQSGK